MMLVKRFEPFGGGQAMAFGLCRVVDTLSM